MTRRSCCCIARAHLRPLLHDQVFDQDSCGQIIATGRAGAFSSSALIIQMPPCRARRFRQSTQVPVKEIAP